MSAPLRQARAMVAGMDPALDPATYVFVATPDADRLSALLPHALGLFREAEGTTLVVSAEIAAVQGFGDGLPMRRITLQVHSASDGVGLTAAVSHALAARDIPCNVISAYHHDNVFVTAAQADVALRAL